jgi:S1-C subfamily serine protease
MSEPVYQSESDHVCETWQAFMQWVCAIAVLAGAILLARYYAPPPGNELHAQVQQLSEQVERLKQEQTMPSLVLNRYRNSICYIFGVYEVGFPQQKPMMRTRISGSGFVVADRLVATNRHVAEPWYGDPDADTLVRKGAVPRLDKLLAFFPGLASPVNLTPVSYSSSGDVAVLRLDNAPGIAQLLPVRLATETPSPGELVAVVGYPMGVVGMVAKSPPAVYEKLAYRRDDMGAANELAALSLIRPSATCGHLGDVVGDKLIYDAPTAHGGSGGPVFNSRAEVIGVNAAYLDGFSGGTLGISVKALWPLISAAERKPAAK